MSGILKSQPSNVNLAPTHVGNFVLSRAPHLMFFTQKVSIPGLTISPAVTHTPLDRLPHPGDSFSRDDLAITFKVDEDHRNYEEIYGWMLGLVAPEDYEQYRVLKNNDSKNPASSTGIYSDITVIINNSSHMANKKYEFRDAWPSSISNLVYETDASTTEFITARVSFTYRNFTISDID